MATLKIPESEYLVLKKIAELDDSSFESFFKAVADADTGLIQSDFSESLASKVPSLKPSEMKPMLKTAANLYIIMYGRKKTVEDVANDLKETFETERPDFLKPEKVLILLGRIKRLLALDGVIGL